VTVGFLVVAILGALFAVVGLRMLRDPSWGNTFVEKDVPKVIRMGVQRSRRTVSLGPASPRR
jgi:hypothetical protein